MSGESVVGQQIGARAPSKCGASGGGGPTSAIGSALKVQLRGLGGYDAQAAALAPRAVQRKGEGETEADPNAQLRREIAEAAKAGGDDDYVRDTITARHLAIASVADKAGMVVNLLDGATADEDEAKILEILRAPGGHAVFVQLSAMGHLQWLWDDMNGEEGEQLATLWADLQKAKSIEDLKQQKAAEAEKQQQAAAAAKARDEQQTPVPSAVEAKAEAPAQGADAAGAPQITDPADPRMSEARKKMIFEGERRMNSRPSGVNKAGTHYVGGKPKNEHGDKAVNLFDGSQIQTKGTSCGLLPGVLLQKLGVNKNPKTAKITQYVTSSPVDGMEGFGTEFGAWVASTGKNRPQPGDIYVMHHTTDGSFAHVGVVHTVGETKWSTMDSGQGRGMQDAAFKAEKTILSEEARKKKGLAPGIYHVPNGNTPDTGGDVERVVRGWVDLDKLMAFVNGA